MKAEINENGILIIEPETKTEEYALERWYSENTNKCTSELKKKAIEIFGIKTFPSCPQLYHSYDKR
jgi:hypothetical protein